MGDQLGELLQTAGIFSNLKKRKTSLKASGILNICSIMLKVCKVRTTEKHTIFYCINALLYEKVASLPSWIFRMVVLPTRHICLHSSCLHLISVPPDWQWQCEAKEDLHLGCLTMWISSSLLSRIALARKKKKNKAKMFL